MDLRNIWFPYDDFETWSIECQKDTTVPSWLTEASNTTEYAQPSSTNGPLPRIYNHSNLVPGHWEEAALLSRSFSPLGTPYRPKINGQGDSAAGISAYDTYWLHNSVISRENRPQMPDPDTPPGAPSQVSAPSVPSNTISDHSHMSSDTNAAAEGSAPATSHGMPGSQGGSIRLHHPSTPPNVQSSFQPELNRRSSALHAMDEGFVRMSFPLHTTDHLLKREALREVMMSSWKINNQFEPEASLLLQFMRHDATEGRWHCSFWRDGKACTCSCKKKDHAKGHVRSHLDLLPYVCSESCPSSLNGCGRRYPAIEPLQKHRKGKATCEGCGMSILPANLKRHMTACPGRAANDAS